MRTVQEMEMLEVPEIRHHGLCECNQLRSSWLSGTHSLRRNALLRLPWGGGGGSFLGWQNTGGCRDGYR